MKRPRLLSLRELRRVPRWCPNPEVRKHSPRPLSELRNRKDTSNIMILVPLLNPKFATVPAAKSCELRIRGTRAGDDSKKSHPALGPAVEQRAHDRIPFRVEGPVGDGLPGPSVPIGGVAGIAFETVQIGMHPGGIVAVLVHDELVRLVPVALAGPP